jgi:hypothetical protein
VKRSNGKHLWQRCFLLLAPALYALVNVITAPLAAADTPPAVYIIYDSSNSMWGVLPDRSRKYEAARVAMRSVTEGDYPGTELALRMYGHRRKSDCSDSELVVPFGESAVVRSAMLEAMERVQPTGKTPIDLSLRQALADFGDRSGSIILISDGIESCDADPCALVQSWSDKNIDIAVHVVGLGLRGEEKKAMQCIADAAGTEYRDAFSTDELAETIAVAVDAAVTQGAVTADAGTPAVQTQAPQFRLVITTPEDDVRQRGAGTLTPADGSDPINVATFRRYAITPGVYQLEAGVQVLGGTVYQPVQSFIEVAEQGITTGSVAAVRPPEVAASFSMAGQEIRTAVVTAYQDGQKLGSFKGDEVAFVPEGTLEFRTRPPGTSNDLIVSETFAAGDFKTISFVADIEVRLTVRVVATATGELIKSKPAVSLLRAGDVISRINSTSGGLVKPGAYTVMIDDGLNVFQSDINVTADVDQIIELPAPSGSVTVTYQDAAGQPEAAKRIFVTRLPEGRRTVRRSDEVFALVPGRYAIDGHPKSAAYPTAEVDIVDGSAVNLTLTATQ